MNTEATGAIEHLDDLTLVLRRAHVALAEIAPALGVTTQSLSQRINGGAITIGEASMIISRAVDVTEDRLSLLRTAVASLALEAN